MGLPTEEPKNIELPINNGDIRHNRNIRNNNNHYNFNIQFRRRLHLYDLSYRFNFNHQSDNQLFLDNNDFEEVD